MKTKIFGMLVVTLLIATVLPVRGTFSEVVNEVDNTNVYTLLNNGLEVTGENWVEKCCVSKEDPPAGDRRVYKYTITNTGNNAISFDRVFINFPSDNLNCSSFGSPINWEGGCLFPNLVCWGGSLITLGPGGSVNNFVVRTICHPQKDGGADAIPKEGIQHWHTWDNTGEKEKKTGTGDMTTTDKDTKVKNSGTAYCPDNPAEHSFDKDHTTYARAVGGPIDNWIIYDLGVVRKFNKIITCSSYPGYYDNPSEIEISVGTMDDGSIDQVIGVFDFPPATNGEMVETDLGVLLEKRYVKIAVMGRWIDAETQGDPIYAEFAEVEFPSYTEPANNPPEKPACSYDRSNDELVVTATDPDGDQVRYCIDWDNDETVDQWTSYVSSGTQQRIDCSGRKGTVGVIAEDEYGALSDWVLQKSKNKAKIFNSLQLWFIENHPLIYQLLQRLLKL